MTRSFYYVVGLVTMVLGVSATTAPTDPCALFSGDVILVGERHDESVGPRLLTWLLAQADHCGVPLECVFLELPNIPRGCKRGASEACAAESSPPWKRRMLTQPLLEAARSSGARLVAVDLGESEIERLGGRVAEEGARVVYGDLLFGRSRHMADKISQSACSSGVALVGDLHVHGPSPNLADLLRERGYLVGTMRARCDLVQGCSRDPSTDDAVLAECM